MQPARRAEEEADNQSGPPTMHIVKINRRLIQTECTSNLPATVQVSAPGYRFHHARRGALAVTAGFD
jgi:hypothetical protein